jgi:8-oxo-dGTP pyrophosphatase MutT (NUDIX family)
VCQSEVYEFICYPIGMDEIVDVVDEVGNVLHQVAKSHAHTEGLLHKTVIGYLRYGYHWALVRQADDRQDAGQLVTPVGGHVSAGESEIDALLREVEEEVGAKNITHKRVGSARFHRQTRGRDENHLFVVFEFWTDDPIVLNEEAVSMHTFSDDDLRQALRDKPADFGDGYYFVLEKFYPGHLPEAYIKRWS